MRDRKETLGYIYAGFVLLLALILILRKVQISFYTIGGASIGALLGILLIVSMIRKSGEVPNPPTGRFETLKDILPLLGGPLIVLFRFFVPAFPEAITHILIGCAVGYLPIILAGMAYMNHRKTQN